MGDNKKVSFYLPHEVLKKLDNLRSQNCERRTRSNMVSVLIEREHYDLEKREAVSIKG